MVSVAKISSDTTSNHEEFEIWNHTFLFLLNNKWSASPSQLVAKERTRCPFPHTTILCPHHRDISHRYFENALYRTFGATRAGRHWRSKWKTFVRRHVRRRCAKRPGIARVKSAFRLEDIEITPRQPRECWGGTQLLGRLAWLKRQQSPHRSYCSRPCSSKGLLGRHALCFLEDVVCLLNRRTIVSDFSWKTLRFRWRRWNPLVSLNIALTYLLRFWN